MTITLEVGSGKTYSTIQSAIDAIPASPADDYVVSIYSGTYDEAILISGKSTTASNDITIKSADENQAITIENSASLFVFYVNNDYVKIDGLGCMTVRCIYSNGRCLKNGAKQFLTLNRIYFTSTVNVFSLIDLNADNPASDATVSNCIFETDNTTERGLLQASGGPNTKIYNNTFITGTTQAIMGIIAFYNLSNQGTALGWEFKNNIIYTTTSNEAFLGRWHSAYQTNIDWTNNIWYAPNASSLKWWDNHTATAYTTYNDFVTAQGETDGHYADPEMVNPGAGDYSLGAGSFAIDEGTNTGLVEDYDGNTRPFNNTYDIGAFEYTEEEAGGSPILCWQLTGRYQNGRLFQLNGSGSYPTEFKIPSNVRRDTINLIDEGQSIPKENYKLI